MGAAVVQLADAAEALLAGRVPYLEAYVGVRLGVVHARSQE